MFDSADQLQTVLGSVMGYYNALIDSLDKQCADWRPMFMDANRKADLDSTSLWVQGFWQAMTFVPDAWSALAEDERTQILVEPFATFVDLGALDGDPMPDNIDEIRHDSASLIPRVLPALRKIAQLRAAELPARAIRKTGRNEPCPCGSGNKYKRCCGLN